MDWLTNLFWHDGKFLGIAWGFWKVIGWLGYAAVISLAWATMWPRAAFALAAQRLARR